MFKHLMINIHYRNVPNKHLSLIQFSRLQALIREWALSRRGAYIVVSILQAAHKYEIGIFIQITIHKYFLSHI